MSFDFLLGFYYEKSKMFQKTFDKLWTELIKSRKTVLSDDRAVKDVVNPANEDVTPGVNFNFLFVSHCSCGSKYVKASQAYVYQTAINSKL